jgi:hypothetical protein
MARLTIGEMAEHLASEMAWDDIDVSALTILDYLAICGYTLTPDKSAKSAKAYAQTLAEETKINA